jgi:LysM repeat protein
MPYTVQSGDTLSNIASRLSASPDEITGINPGVNFSVPLQNGQTICLPAGNE